LVQSWARVGARVGRVWGALAASGGARQGHLGQVTYVRVYGVGRVLAPRKPFGLA